MVMVVLVPYRDGFTEAYALFRERLEVLSARATRTGLEALPRVRVERFAARQRAIDALEPVDTQELDAAERMLDEHERDLADLDNLRLQLDAATRRDRAARRRRLVFAGGAAAVVAALVVASTRREVEAVDGDEEPFVYAAAVDRHDVGADPACVDTLECVWGGRCKTSEHGCVATSDDMCRSSFRCERHGECTHVGDGCRAASDADCSGTWVCVRADQCHARDGTCVRDE